MSLQVGVKLLIRNEDGRYLFVRRSASYKSGSRPWDIPGGRINTEEPLFEALVREVHEETGMTVTAEPTLIAAQDIFVTEKELHVVRLTYVGNAEGDITLSDEHDEYAWMTKEEVLEKDVDSYIRKIQDRF